jgi:hypothetical protein
MASRPCWLAAAAAVAIVVAAMMLFMVCSMVIMCFDVASYEEMDR